MAAQTLRVGEQVVRGDGSLGVVTAVGVVPGAAVRYNLTVQDLHTYLVGDDQWVVHNCGGNIPWSSKSVKNASNALDSGANEVTVVNKSEAGELYLGKFHGEGYRNTSGWNAMETKDYYFTKEGTYHWDETIDPEGGLLEHGGDNPHGNLPHLQIHTFTDGPWGGRIIRIFFGT